jgi:hypothetical protein
METVLSSCHRSEHHKVSVRGMGLYAGILVKPGYLLEVEFGIPCHFRMMAVVRQRSGYCFGLEFIAPLPT